MKNSIWISIALFLSSSLAYGDLGQNADFYQGLFGNPSGPTVISDSSMNRGETRPKAILKGVFYFGGSDVRRSLLSRGFQNTLCENGFSQLYSVYNSVSDNFSCSKGNMSYQHIGEAKSSPGRGDRVYNLMAEIHKIIKSNGSLGPIYLHCYYGVHASNTIAQMVLKQFCGIGDREAISNWDKIDLYDSLGQSGAQRQAQKIRNFQPYSEFQISAAEKAIVCY